MDTTVGLNAAQLFEVTKRKRASKQIEALVFMKIPFRVRPDGTPFVAADSLTSSKTVERTIPKPVLTLI